jgi:hypothetical protein
MRYTFGNASWATNSSLTLRMTGVAGALRLTFGNIWWVINASLTLSMTVRFGFSLHLCMGEEKSCNEKTPLTVPLLKVKSFFSILELNLIAYRRRKT